MNYILLQTIISSVKSLTKGTLIIAGYISLIIFGFLALIFAAVTVAYLIPVLIPICLILSFTKPIKDLLIKMNPSGSPDFTPKTIQLNFSILMFFQAVTIFMFYKYSYFSESLKADKDPNKSLFLNTLSYIMNIHPENINSFLFYENLSFIMALCLLLLFLIMFLFYPGIKSFISHHKKVAQEKYDSLSNHEKLTKF